MTQAVRPRPAARPRPTGLLVDRDGVLRRWDPAVQASIEERHGLPPGTILDAMMGPDRLVPAVTGRLRHAEWMDGVAMDLAGKFHGDEAAARAAVAEYAAYRGTVDPGVLALVRAVRAAGRPVGLATNSTDLLDEDLSTMDVAGDFDVVVNSWRLGVVKPQPGYYRLACEALGLPPAEVILLDDSVRFVAGARAAGLYAHRYAGPADLGYIIAALGLSPIG